MNDRDNYNIGFFKEYLIGLTESLIECIIILQDETASSDPRPIYEILEIPEGFYNEIIVIIQKYSNCTIKQITQKVLYECSYRYYGHI